MTHRHAAFGPLLRTVGRAADPRTDARLLADFYAHRDEAAFAALVRRHQRAVWSVCARVLDPAAAEDAFQATFLVLVRSGRLLADRGSVGGWLYRVADRVARKARIMAIHRKRRERTAGRSEVVADRPADADLFGVVAEEIDRLPENHRLAVALCDLEGLSRADAAARLGWQEGTLSARLHRGRKRLAERLRARGVTAPLVGLTAVAVSAVPGRAADATAELACVMIASGLTNRAVPASVAALVTQTTKEMAMRITTKVLAVLTLATGVIGFGWLGMPGGADPRATAAPVPEAKKEGKPDLAPSALQLLRHRKVLRELKCTADQRVTIEDHFDDQAEAAAAKGGGDIELTFPPNGVPNPNVIWQQTEAKMKERQDVEAAEIKAMAEKVLKASQLVRLAEIDLQVRGAEAFADPKVADALKLTDDQKRAVGEAIGEGKKMGNRVPPPGPGGPGAPGVVTMWAGSNPFEPKARKAAYEKAEECLTKEQKATWKQMTGEAVSFDPHAVGAGRGGAGGAAFGFGGGVRVMPAGGAPALPAALPPKKDDK